MSKKGRATLGPPLLYFPRANARRRMDAEKYRVFMAVAAIATTLTFFVKYGPDASVLATAWAAATRHPWLAVGLTLPVVAGLTWGVVRWLDER